MKISSAISPCPNDTFIFFPIILDLISTNYNYSFEFFDVQELNEGMLNSTFDLGKISYATYPLLSDKYDILDCGSALGRGVGPLLISKHIHPQQINENQTVAIPGELTTAHQLFSTFYPNFKHKKFVRFDQIQQMLIDDEVDLGVIIHENKFTYVDLGLHCIADLGTLWESKTNLPTPLGGIVVREKFTDNIKKNILNDVQNSLDYAYKNVDKGMDFILKKADIKDKSIVQKHIQMYVNDYSKSLGEEGKLAVKRFLEQKTHSFNANKCNFVI